MTHTFELTRKWMGGLCGSGLFETKTVESHFSVPKPFGGEGQGTNPEDLLLSAASTCFLMTLGIALTFRKITFASVCLKSIAHLDTDGRNFRLTKIEHFPVVLLASGETGKALEAIRAAEKNCLVANALRGNVEIIVKSKVEVVRA